MKKKGLDYYMNLPYEIETSPEEDGFVVSIPDLKGCVAFGTTMEDALQTLTKVKRAWIEIALERKWQIPDPEPIADGAGTAAETKEDDEKENLGRHLYRRRASWLRSWLCGLAGGSVGT